MGHKRTGFLPKTKKWRDIVDQMGSYTNHVDSIANIAEQTLENVKSRFEFIEKDSGVIAAFKFLIYLSYSAKLTKPKEFFATQGIQINGDPTPLQLAKSINNWFADKTDSLEYAAFAKSATIDALSLWHQHNNTNQESLFVSKDPYEIWRGTSDGSGFCEISRMYFAKFTERYLKYFLEREASSAITNIKDRDAFNFQLERHVNDISMHSFEIFKITQSFAAGWFNKNVSTTIPTDRKIEKFVSFAFAKIRAELSRGKNDK